jgi:hypothetical protein
MNKLDIIVDFDGTVVTHEFPRVGKDIGAVPVLKKLVANGHKLILFTMRSERPFMNFNGSVRYVLDEAVEWFVKNDIPLYGVNTNPEQKDWTSSPKAFGQLMIDDIALGCPIKVDKKKSQRPFVDWEKVEELLIEKGLIEKDDNERTN